MTEKEESSSHPSLEVDHFHRLERLLTELQVFIPLLNRTTDNANNLYRRVEGVLSKLRVGVCAEVVVEKIDETRSLLLVYARINGEFRIGFEVRASTPCSLGDPFPVPWDQSPRNHKIIGMVALEALLVEILAEAQRVLGRVVGPPPTFMNILGESTKP